MTDEPTPHQRPDEVDPHETLLAGEIRGLRDELRGVRAELHQLNQAIATRAPVPPAIARPGLLPRSIATIFGVGARADARWRSYRARFPGEWAPGGPRRDLIAVAIVLAVAGVLRYYHLDTIPLGFQGDEAAAGLEARRIIEDGWIGVFSPASGGNPTGFYGLAVIPVWFLEDTVLTIRLLSATLDMLTVLGLYVALRRGFGWGTALLGAGFLAVSGWHIQFARIAFMNVLWPLTVMIGVLALAEAHRRRSNVWWAISGAGFATGIYAYNAHFLYLAVVGLAMAWIFFGWTAPIAGGLILLAVREPGLPTLGAAAAGAILLILNRKLRERGRLFPAAAFGAGFAVTIFPMARFIVENEEVYFGRGRRLTIFRTEAWTELTSWPDRVWFLIERYGEFWRRLAFEPTVDTIAGSGTAGVVPLTALILAAIGIGFGLARRFNPLVCLGIATVFLMPLAPIASDDFALRRAMIMAPFLAMFGGIAIVEIMRSVWHRRVIVRVAVAVILLAVTVNIGYRNINDFFTNTARSPSMDFVMGPEVVYASDFLNDLSEEDYVYLFSVRWPFGHENVRFLAPDTRGETRGEPYGPDSIAIDPANGRAVFVLMGEYQQRLPEIQARYPGGTVVEGPPLPYGDRGPTYIAYLLPEPGAAGP